MSKGVWPLTALQNQREAPGLRTRGPEVWLPPPFWPHPVPVPAPFEGMPRLRTGHANTSGLDSNTTSQAQIRPDDAQASSALKGQGLVPVA